MSSPQILPPVRRPDKPTPHDGSMVAIRKLITVGSDGEVTDGMVAAYLAKYATKSTEITGHVSGRLNDATVDLYADPDGDHIARLVDACWRLGDSRPTRPPREPRECPGCGRTTRLVACPSCPAPEESFRTKALANSFRSELVKATNDGQPFDRATGRPV